ncbi:DEAD/DEAH box helicase family protein [Paucisalibacillus globulus]|uniref:DEAD/DEAH box helicase family protein n=1 Tax=Paucisalibacillus globulus TaxID=351095 RepID=UPI000BB8DBD7|nr:DEAD/DEAH box helicase family protein [Paucisalibacillus globulus]
MVILPFQLKASNQIAKRFNDYMSDPLTVTRTKIVPFYQNLSSITGSGKTLILSDAIEQIRSTLPVQPIVLWLSKGKVVVWQTYSNLSSGKYSSVLSGFNVKPLLDCKPKDITQSDKGLVLIATVGKFNQKDKDQGDRKIFKVQLDSADDSLWELLKKRRNHNGIRRPFIIVYDEGHNLSNQQTDLLLELEPDALIAASATVKVPESLKKIIDRLRDDKGWNDEDFITSVKSSEVVKSGLVKQNILLGGYVTPMEETIDDMIEEFKRVSGVAKNCSKPFSPKAIYVTNTNIISGVEKDQIKQPFHDRLARPIVIWRYLVEEKGINPSEIAVYCNLKFDKKFPPPDNFHLFSGGDSDYDDFIDGDYKHIIFNQTLQEGWDDPSCYFAYIDKDMGSRIQIEQIIGRALRQPGVTHYAEQELNTAQFYIRTDEKSVFEEVLLEVKAKLASESPEINLQYFKSGSGKDRPLQAPQKKLYVPEISIYSESAKKPIKNVIDNIQDFRDDKVNTIGKGGRIQVLQTIGSENDHDVEWVELDHSNPVSARWIFVREIQKYYAKAVNLSDIENVKFDALVEYNSRAAEHLRESAYKVVEDYLDYSIVIQNNLNNIEAPSLPVNPNDKIKFNNSLHEGYSGLNEFEKKFALGLDNKNYDWMRNPSRGFFEVPLLSLGSTKNFNPDFIVWQKDSIVAIDTKGDHLIVEDSSKKLFHLKQVGKGQELKIRLITQGKWDDNISKITKNGYTVWVLKNGKIKPIWCKDIEETIDVCLDGTYD